MLEYELEPSGSSFRKVLKMLTRDESIRRPISSIRYIALCLSSMPPRLQLLTVLSASGYPQDHEDIVRRPLERLPSVLPAACDGWWSLVPEPPRRFLQTVTVGRRPY